MQIMSFFQMLTKAVSPAPSEKVELKASPLTSPPAPKTSLAPQDAAPKQTQPGSAVSNLTFAQEPPKLDLLGLKQGDQLAVDGISSANGTATVKTLNADAFELKTAIHIPWVARGIAGESFKLVDNRVDLSIKLTKKGDKYKYQLVDNNSGKVKGSGLSDLDIKNGRKGGSQTQSISVKTSQGNLVIRLEQSASGKVSGSVDIPGLPSIINTFDLDKK